MQIFRRLIYCLIMVASGPTFAQEAYPNKPIKIFVGFPAGTSTDIIARVYAQNLSEALKVPVVVENKAGASSNIAAESVFNADPNGYSLLLGTIANSITSSLYKNLEFNFANDFSPIAMVGSATTVLVVKANSNISNVQELINMAKTNPKEVTFGSAGIGTAPHMAGELLNLMAGISMLHIPYKGNNQGITDLIGGQLTAVFTPLPTAINFIRDGKVKALAVTSLKRSNQLPEVPTLSESGFPGFDTSIWYGFLAPKKTPKTIISQLSEALRKASNAPVVKSQLLTNGAEATYSGPDEFGKYIQSESQKWQKVIEKSKVSIE
ncbi:tripartite tricarboxylate transporter substrate binding protein [Polynucleobacter sp. AP-Latsch-80-C2]|uniref:Bug family tripartite tricarboxylate transporter substrate binding protein n=1 Tax=Polynucleobacter sp. AP-Latsch-80-C2 TaxID=2576931 RepID=UPI001C0B3C29|nr:tripartite tricarboxylate transporter substrate binding protein [Polynucleobacter sp. AP-Latsch-80-C2]MBU3624324.1 tripartite tricarboxylate transporter substrate binding protein [Polynucleobacter sp. AP-Latsch-80-C2]